MLAKSISGAAAAASPAYIEDVFSTYLYTGNVSTQTITNNIDLSGKGGLVWTKSRSISQVGRIYDTVRGAQYDLIPSLSNQQALSSPAAINFSSSGFGLVADNSNNQSGVTYASWTFREQAKFFDIVTYTGNGSNRTIAHNLGSVPGCIIVKRTDTAADWQVYHRSLANTEYMVLNSTAAKATGTTRWNSTTPTSTEFSLGTDNTVNASGGTYVAYLFAHDAGGFGLTGTDNVISCGSFTTGVAPTVDVSLGWEPQWVLLRATNQLDNWAIVDNMRGLADVSDIGNTDARSLLANNANEEQSVNTRFAPSAAGFRFQGLASSTYIYIAIRRGPMKVPTSGTSVFTPVVRDGTGAKTTTTAGFPVDMGMTAKRNGSAQAFSLVDRLRNKQFLITALDQNGITDSDEKRYQNNTFDSQSGIKIGNAIGGSETNESGQPYVDHLFRRAPGFFDVVCYTGTGANRTINHNLAAVPELILVKRRDNLGDWWVYNTATGNTKYQVLNSTAAPVTSSTAWNNTTPTSTVFTVGTGTPVNASAGTYIAYLFATVTGVSKVGSYTGTGTTNQINCGFTGGARFVLIKRTDSTGHWYVWDTARGIVAGNDPYLLLNSQGPEVTNTDYIDTYSAGFEISSTAPAAINANGGTFIFLAIA